MILPIDDGPRFHSMQEIDILVQKIQGEGVPLRDLESGRPFGILVSAINDISTAECERFKPPTFGFESVREFLTQMIPFVTQTDHWILAYLVSEVTRFWWRWSRLAKPILGLEGIGNIPIPQPHPEYINRLEFLVGKIVSEGSDLGLLCERVADLNDLVDSTLRLTIQEISIIDYANRVHGGLRS